MIHNIAINLFLIMKSKYKRRLFLNSCKTDSGLIVGPAASCLNSGHKDNIKIGKDVTIFGSLHTQGHGIIEIGDFTNIRYNTYIGAVNSIKIGKYVIISHDIFIYDNNNHPISPKQRQILSEKKFEESLNSWTNADSAPVIIEDNVWIGFGAVILRGVKVGKGSIVGAQAVVTKDVPPFSVAVGNPAKIVKTLTNDLC